MALCPPYLTYRATFTDGIVFHIATAGVNPFNYRDVAALVRWLRYWTSGTAFDLQQVDGYVVRLVRLDRQRGDGSWAIGVKFSIPKPRPPLPLTMSEQVPPNTDSLVEVWPA